MIKQYQRFFNMIQVSLDVFSLLLAYAVALVVDNHLDIINESVGPHHLAPFWMMPVLLVVFYCLGLYTPMRSRSFRTEAKMLAKAHFLGMILIQNVLFLLPSLRYSREMAIYFSILGFLSLLGERYTVRRPLRYLRYRGYNQKHVLVLGAGALGREFLSKVRSHPQFGYHVVGLLDDEATEGDTVSGHKVLGSCGQLEEILEKNGVEEVVAALPLKAYPHLGSYVQLCEKAGVRIRIIPAYCEFLPHRFPQADEFDGIPLLGVHKNPLDDPLWRLFKRGFDIVVAASALLVTSPLLVLIALGVKLTSSGPLLFRQKRVGLNNHTFEMLKFRSMKVETASTASTTWTTANDPRKTRFGTFLRKTSLDELPQFFNVLRGDMSVIGPRPERPFFVEQFKEEIPLYMVKHQVKPGITGWAQVNGWRGDTSIQKRIECDLYYIENWKVLFDIKILFLTLSRGLVNKNAY